jgi:PPOX class probable F420-dependent enzyme
MTDLTASGESHLERWFGRLTTGVLATLHPDGRPQLSTVRFTYRDRVARISLTETRVKTRNLRRDPRAALYVQPSFERFFVAEGTAELTATSITPGDDVGRELAALYESIAGPHPDWDDYFRAMVADRRLVLRLHVDHIYRGGTDT